MIQKNDYSNKNNSKLLFYSNPLDIEFLTNLIVNSSSKFGLDNTFIVFESINYVLYLIYADENKSIISYNIIDNCIANKIKNAHNRYITNFRHFLDKFNKRDLIISISYEDNNIKLWNINNFECLLNIKDANKSGELYSACFLYENNQIYIISSNNKNYSDDIQPTEPIRVFDLNGNKVKEIEDSDEDTFFIDSYYDNKLCKNFIIAGNIFNSKSYDFNENKLYYNYSNYDIEYSYSIIINENEKIIKLIS